MYSLYVCVLHDKVHYFKWDDKNQVRLTSLIGATTSDTLISNTHINLLIENASLCVCVCAYLINKDIICWTTFYSLFMCACMALINEYACVCMLDQWLYHPFLHVCIHILTFVEFKHAHVQGWALRHIASTLYVSPFRYVANFSENSIFVSIQCQTWYTSTH